MRTLFSRLMSAIFVALLFMGYSGNSFAYATCDPYNVVLPCTSPSNIDMDSFIGVSDRIAFYDSRSTTINDTENAGYWTLTSIAPSYGYAQCYFYSASGNWASPDYVGGNGQSYFLKSNAGFSWTGKGSVPSYLSFPIDGLTAYNAPVSSVMDHSMTTPYAEDDIVLAFNGERGDKSYGFNLGCYKKSGGGDFGSGFNYVGTTGTGGKPYFCYDGHPGYDYPQASGVDILAPATGKLCVATTYTAQRSPANVWRSQTACGDIPSVVTERWLDTDGFNAFYIFHTEYINGTTDDYMTVFLHSNNLENTIVWSTVASQGYVIVTRGQYIADVGSVGAGTANHMHLEVYKKVSGVWTRVDPYGDGTNNILWQH